LISYKVHFITDIFTKTQTLIEKNAQLHAQAESVLTIPQHCDTLQC